MNINLNAPRLDAGKPLTAADFARHDEDERPISGAGPAVYLVLLVPAAAILIPALWHWLAR